MRNTLFAEEISIKVVKALAGSVICFLLTHNSLKVNSAESTTRHLKQHSCALMSWCNANLYHCNTFCSNLPLNPWRHLLLLPSTAQQTLETFPHPAAKLELRNIAERCLYTPYIAAQTFATNCMFNLLSLKRMRKLGIYQTAFESAFDSAFYTILNRCFYGYKDEMGNKDKTQGTL